MSSGGRGRSSYPHPTIWRHLEWREDQVYLRVRVSQASPAARSRFRPDFHSAQRAQLPRATLNCCWWISEAAKQCGIIRRSLHCFDRVGASRAPCHDSSRQKGRSCSSCLRHPLFALRSETWLDYRILSTGRDCCHLKGCLQAPFLVSSRNGLCARSRPIVVAGPCPQYTVYAFGNVMSSSWRLDINTSNEPSHRSVRPIEF